MNSRSPVKESLVPEALQSKLQELFSLGIDIPEELFDFLDILITGAQKYGANNWLEKNGSKTSHKDMHASLFRHVAESSSNPPSLLPDGEAMTVVDYESRKHPLLHAMIRCGMIYTRQKRNIWNDSDDLGNLDRFWNV